jgi:carbonic anhydrase/acetyltransferase-like protein (isoleucine patch superfamily)
MLFKFEGKTPVVGKNSYVSETAQVIGDVVIGDSCYMGHRAIIRGDYGRVEIGEWTIVAEGAVVKASGRTHFVHHECKRIFHYVFSIHNTRESKKE